MVSKIFIYIEGGGDKLGKIKIREGFNKFMEDLMTPARKRRISWKNVPCGSRKVRTNH